MVINMNANNATGPGENNPNDTVVKTEPFDGNSTDCFNPQLHFMPSNSRFYPVQGNSTPQRSMTLTPPSSEPSTSPPKNSPNRDHPEQVGDHLNHLQTMRVPTPTPKLCPPDSANPLAGNGGQKTPKTPNVKSKRYECKYCSYVTYSKQENYEHRRVHIPQDKRMDCNLCTFSTDLKHHFDYHINNHKGIKPFKCSQCDYACVNKSMLNSHVKSHSDVYMYSCKNCAYSTKYLHSLKIHCRKNKHEADTPLNPDGRRNPYAFVDVYGSRRGPRARPNIKGEHNVVRQQEPGATPCVPSAQPMLQNQPGLLPPFVVPPVFNQLLMSQMLGNMGQTGVPPTDVVRACIERLALIQQAEQQWRMLQHLPEQHQEMVQPQRTPSPPTQVTQVLDLSRRSECPTTSSPPQKSPGSQDSERLRNLSSEEDYESAGYAMCVEAVYNSEDDDTSESKRRQVNTTPTNNNDASVPDNNTCCFCDITFGNNIMFEIHMGYHSHKNPFDCNKCGVRFQDAITFFSHIGSRCKVE